MRDRVELRFPMAVRTSTWFNNSISVERGPLVYSLKIGESWHKIKQTGPAADWEVYPTTPWNYALVKGAFQVTEQAMQRQPFTAERRACGDHGEGAASAAMDAGGRFARPAAGESGDHQARRGDGDAGALRRGEAADHGVPVARVEAAGNSSPQMYLLNQS